MSFEPETKKQKLSAHCSIKNFNLEDRLNGILCCAVCLDLPRTCFQCINGHLMCSGCFNHLLADARLKDETPTCPNCRCEISKNSCTRNLAVENAASELPLECKFCNQSLPRNKLEYHEKELCQERPSICKYSRIGCPWRGPYHEIWEHESSCIHPEKTGAEIMDAMKTVDAKQTEEKKSFGSIFNLLSLEKITFNDLQLKPYRTDDFIAKLFYETSRFSAFNHQWVIKARANQDQKYPTQTCSRSVTYQLILKSKITTPIRLHYLVLKGPHSEAKVKPTIYEHEFSADSTESENREFPLLDANECNKVLAGKTINFRVILFQVTQ
ncbi:hypothetical protein LOTGIDRAFT_138168 [Lottia gigantea]|uniref:RING-type domain-containing protein n=1 Tax=Lottia gigantea TaxID=225164 RepID=V4B522_LOTGI|nr:hypothetical protein LOTGIDRAFT_138168 [Lottia gigantea]ESP02606.1 hypothetical protein LOTGIDRAFT_138168 [Lottia gigantea]